MPVKGASQHSYTFDALTELKDAGAVVASGAATVGGSARVLDFGNTVNGVEQIAYTKGALVVDVSAIDGVTGDESYDIIVQLSDNATFASGNVKTKAAMHLGVAQGPDGDAQYVTGENVIEVDNEFFGTIYRYMRVAHVLAGMTPSINYRAFLGRKQPA